MDTTKIDTLVTGALGAGVSQAVHTVANNPSVVEASIHVIIQIIIGVVTLWHLFSPKKANTDNSNNN